MYEQQFEFLKEVIQFRKNNEYDQYSQLGCNLLHYDLLISGLLLMLSLMIIHINTFKIRFS